MDEENRPDLSKVWPEPPASVAPGARIEVDYPKDQPVALGTRAYLSYRHLEAAIMTANAARAHEDGFVENKPGADLRRVASLTSATILSSVGFLEGLINEVYHDASDQVPTGVVAGLPKQKVDAIARACRTTEDLRSGMVRPLAENHGVNEDRLTLVKYQLVLAIMGKDLMDKGRQPYQDAALLIQVRNDLTHAQPVDQIIDSNDEAIPVEDHPLEEKLRPKVEPNQYVGDDPANAAYKYLSADCSRWALESAYRFSRHFLQKIGAEMPNQHRSLWSEREDISLGPTPSGQESGT